MTALRTLVESNRFQNVIIALILVNAVILGMETSDYLMSQYGFWLKLFDKLILAVFVVEILAKFVVYQFGFFKRPWSVFDLVVVVIALVPASEAFAALRTLRILRVLRLISVVPTMRRVIEGLISAIPGIASVATIMLLFFYVFAVVGTHLYSDTFPQWFGNLGQTMYSLFQIMTLESWSMGIVRPVMEQHPYAWAFFVSYILVTTFTMLNLFIAIIVNAMHEDTENEAKESLELMKAEISEQVKASEKRILKELRSSK